MPHLWANGLAVFAIGVGVVVLAACGGPAGPVVTDGGDTCPAAAPTSCPSPTPRYPDVRPIFEQHCVPCHAGLPNGPWPLTSYSHVADWEQELRGALIDCSMPPPDAGSAFTGAERRAILLWLRCGLPE